ncbi:UNVERIFIED_CONTAM: hypothetical protein Slati_3977200 [Sesamum latifolium]|uniref:Uncharacterized protein n=1 Tax=Sesamum latifolium TaxID=2727402 RepID=A0AAW2TNZ5_9LAMI
MEFTKKCESCQKYATLIHSPMTPMEPIKIACPFNQWGTDILGPFPPAPAQKKLIVVAVGYFFKWMKAKALAKISEKEVRNTENTDLGQWDAIPRQKDCRVVQGIEDPIQFYSCR